MTFACQPVERHAVALRESVFQHRFNLVRDYVLSLRSESLLQNFYLEAGLRHWSFGSLEGNQQLHDLHWGWESPTALHRGQFLGHWLSAAAQIFAATGDGEVKAKADAVVGELARCQERNGGGWLGPSPEKNLRWITEDARGLVPNYVHHKTLMGLYDMSALAGNAQALELADRFSSWFHRWAMPFSRQQMDDILEIETGGMLEVFANLYAATKAQKYLDLMERYTRNRLYQALLEGADPLTNMHANTTIPEAHGAARCHEVTGDARWRRIVEAYWKCAVTDRGSFCTGSQTSGEVWTPPRAFAARLGNKTQEHCCVYNLIRLADYLYRWTHDAAYQNYIERNLYNGILAQQHPGTGMVAYYLPLEAGARKKWGTRTHDFWCCHGSLVQAHPMLRSLFYYRTPQGVTIAQYIPSQLTTRIHDTAVTITQEFVAGSGDTQRLAPDVGAWNQRPHRPEAWTIRLQISCAAPTEFDLCLRLPDWLAAPARLRLNGQEIPVEAREGYARQRRPWHQDTLLLELPKALTAQPLPDEPGTVAFLDGPVVLAGLSDKQVTLKGDPAAPRGILAPDNERQWQQWLGNWRTVGQPVNFRFKPLHEIADETYTVYFPVAPP
ncbi:MAG: beta-L-arabinofuranosidase domain-containing protein [Lentisphaeria bacterium]|jgi:hypothetical protein